MFLKLLELISLLLYGDLGRFVGVVYAHCVVSYLGRVWLWLWLLQYAFRSQVAYSFLELLLSEICSTELSSRIVNENLRGCQICKRVHDVREVLYSVFSFFASMRSKLISSEVRLIKELYGNQVGELYNSLPYHMVEFVLDDFDCKVTLSLKYADLLSIVPTEVSVLVWPMHQSKKSISAVTMTRKENEVLGSQPIPTRLSYAEDALRTMSLPEAYAEIVLNLPQVLKEIYPQQYFA
ncbi:uncharacterized protein LOC111402094 isoform X3 [Olea europaea var. sylvestris]|uniref:uncharacterized protein LOC111402094 isoform X3 n=1 Tax=Olea europaea var. sylvestris TaxID=158386 RepID=UPI000C1CF924|nr:uncharacterized protein LOC111402094 isoform X3 [Olea europaea var. sylvestris]